MYTSIRRNRSVSAEEVLRRAKQGFVPIISRTPGFIAYYSLNAGNGVLASVSIHPNLGEEPRDCYCYAIVK